MRRKAGKWRGFLETKKFAQGIKVRLPVLTIIGVRPGPFVLIISSQHGREINGIAAIEKVWNNLHPEKIRGRIVFLPVMNPLAVRMRSQDFPVEQPRYRPTGIDGCLYNMNRKWSFSREDETYAASVAQVVWKTYWRYADFSLDLHGWTDRSLSLAWGHRRYLKLLRSYGFPYHVVLEKLPSTPGMSETAAFQAGICHLVNELAPQNRIVLEIVNQAATCILNLLKSAGVLEGKPVLPAVQYEFNQNHEEIQAKAPVEGLLIPEKKPGEFVLKGQVVARIVSLETLKTIWEFSAPKDSLVFNSGGGPWGEDYLDSNIVSPGQLVALLKVPDTILKNEGKK